MELKTVNNTKYLGSTVTTVSTKSRVKEEVKLRRASVATVAGH